MGQRGTLQRPDPDTDYGWTVTRAEERLRSGTNVFHVGVDALRVH